MEILSEHTTTIDRIKKKMLYARHGTKEYWIVDPEVKKVDLFLIENNQFKRVDEAKRGETLTSQIIQGLQVPIAGILT